MSNESVNANVRSVKVPCTSPRIGVQVRAKVDHNEGNLSLVIVRDRYIRDPTQAFKK